MNNKDNKRGFSGLSDLTSDTQSIPQAQPHQVSPKPSAPQNTKFALLEPMKQPSLPASWSSVDAGETWVWGDFFLTFQKEPETFIDFALALDLLEPGIAKKVQAQKKEYRITYHYAMSVFYRLDRNPHGPSHRPIMVVTLEQVDTTALARILGREAGESLPMIGLFTSKAHLNFGEYEGDNNPHAVKRKFFEILRQQLGVNGQPKMIGNLAQAFGHPETGLPAKKKGSGPERTTKISSPLIETISSNGKWILGILGIVFVIWLIKSSPPSTVQTQEDDPGRIHVTDEQLERWGGLEDDFSVPPEEDLARFSLQYKQPPVGTDNTLSVPEIRWCIRESIRIEAVRDVIDTSAGIYEFNRSVNDYNNRCGSYRYRQGSWSQAKREVEDLRNQIVREAQALREEAMRQQQPRQ